MGGSHGLLHAWPRSVSILWCPPQKPEVDEETQAIALSKVHELNWIVQTILPQVHLRKDHSHYPIQLNLAECDCLCSLPLLMWMHASSGRRWVMTSSKALEVRPQPAGKAEEVTGKLRRMRFTGTLSLSSAFLTGTAEAVVSAAVCSSGTGPPSSSSSLPRHRCSRRRALSGRPRSARRGVHHGAQRCSAV